MMNVGRSRGDSAGQLGIRPRNFEVRDGSVVAGIGFHIGEYLFVLDSYHQRAATVIAEVDIYVHAVDVPYPPQESLPMPWNGGLAVELGQTAQDLVETLGCLRAIPRAETRRRVQPDPWARDTESVHQLARGWHPAVEFLR